MSKREIVHAAKPLVAEIIRPVTFAQMTDAEIGAAASEAIDRAVSMRHDSAEQALRAGELLLEAKHRCREGGVSFSHWLAKHWTTKSRTTAYAYLKIATEVQSNSVGAPTNRDLLACQSIRQFLTDRGYGAGGTRDDPVDDEEREAKEEATIERLIADSQAAPEPAKPRGPAPSRGGLSASAGTIDPAEMTRRAEAQAMAERERAAIEEANKRPPLVQRPPENPHQVGHQKPATAPPVSLAGPLREVVALLADARRRLLLLVLGAPTPSTTKQFGEAQQVFVPFVARWEQVLSQVADEDQESVEFTIKAEKKR